MRADTLNDPDVAITVFVPTDAAFEAFFVSQNMTTEDLLDSDFLVPLLNYHMVPAVIPVAAMSDNEELSTFLDGQNLTLSIPDTSSRVVTVIAAQSTAHIIGADTPAGQVPPSLHLSSHARLSSLAPSHGRSHKPFECNPDDISLEYCSASMANVVSVMCHLVLVLVCSHMAYHIVCFRICKDTELQASSCP